MKKLLLLITPLALLFLGHSLIAQGMQSKQIDELVLKALESTPSVGIAVAVVKDGKIIHSKGYGVKSIESEDLVDENTLFAIASNSKAFTATALAILVDEGKLQWDDKVIDYIPEFKMYDDYVTANFTILDLLTHRSGLGMGAGDLMVFPDGSNFTIQDIVKSFQFQKPVSAFRTKYYYNNQLYIVAGEIVARISGLSWVEFIQSKIFAPLGMTNSVASSSKLQKNSNLALPHDSEGDKINQLKTYECDLFAAAAGIYSSVNDLSKWLIMHLNKGKYGKDLSDQMVSEKQQHQMWKPHTNLGFSVMPNPRSKSHFTAYGLGWELNDMDSKIVLSHTGGLPGMLSRTLLVPELNLGIIVLTNSLYGGGAFYSISKMILDSYMDVEPINWLKNNSERFIARRHEADSILSAVWNTVKDNKSSVINLQNYTGTYSDNWFGEVEITLKDKKLWFASKRSPKLKGHMYFYKATTFAIKWEYKDMNADAFATFSLDKEGKGVGIKMIGISPYIDFSFDFHDLDFKRVNKE